MENKTWDDWQKEVIHEEYVEPDLSAKKLKMSIEKINKKYSNSYISVEKKQKIWKD
ncbi:hypothetical protein ACFFHM_02095 [Halalkalibacter kiskunsagensis]|uniref:Uncharacterized protein n=1 Tax=Halalkalibacter kiskunsagensis TaxID=1548599 RepID=A0ABV6K7R5_9BACI